MRLEGSGKAGHLELLRRQPSVTWRAFKGHLEHHQFQPRHRALTNLSFSLVSFSILHPLSRRYWSVNQIAWSLPLASMGQWSGICWRGHWEASMRGKRWGSACSTHIVMWFKSVMIINSHLWWFKWRSRPVSLLIVGWLYHIHSESNDRPRGSNPATHSEWILSLCLT